MRPANESTGRHCALVEDFERSPEMLRIHIAELEFEHRALDERIAALVQDPDFDQLELRRMKKRKLAVKDTIARLHSLLIPDQPA
jgi:hypothetical protein